jgi:hypothetical protein
MSFRLVEQFVQGKSPDPNKCEDFVWFSDHYVVVVDGSSIRGRDFEGKTSGRFIAEAILEGVQRLAPGLDMETAVRQINAHVRARIGYRDDAEIRATAPRPTASVSIVSFDRMEFWGIGDTMLQIDGKDIDLSKKIDHITTAARVAWVKFERMKGRSIEDLLADTGDLDSIQPLLQRQHRAMNNIDGDDLAYANFDGSDDVIQLIKVIPLPPGCREIIMASDGYPKLFNTLAASEAELIRVLREDPLMIRLYPQVKGLRPGLLSFDDRCYMRLARV